MKFNIDGGVLSIDCKPLRPVASMTELECQQEWFALKEYRGGFDMPVVNARLAILENKILMCKPQQKVKVKDDWGW